MKNAGGGARLDAVYAADRMEEPEDKTWMK